MDDAERPVALVHPVPRDVLAEEHDGDRIVGHPDAKLLAIEINPGFCDLLRETIDDRRLIVHESRVEPLLARLKTAYTQVRIGDPLAPGTLMGPLIDAAAVANHVAAIAEAKLSGGKLICLDELSSDERLVADHCAKTSIAIQDLSSTHTTTIQPPADVNGFNFVGIKPAATRRVNSAFNCAELGGCTVPGASL